MKKKKVFREVLSIIIEFIFNFGFGITLSRIVLGRIDPVTIICFCICLIGTFKDFIIIGICKLIIKYLENITYNNYKKSFKSLKIVHIQRYRAYLSGETERIKKVSKDYEEFSIWIIKEGKKLLDESSLSKKKKRQIQEIIDKTRELESKIYSE